MTFGHIDHDIVLAWQEGVKGGFPPQRKGGCVVLVLLPGLDGSGLLFEPLLRALGGSLPVRVLAYPAQLAGDYDTLAAWVRTQLPDQPFALGAFFPDDTLALAQRVLAKVAGGLVRAAESAHLAALAGNQC